MRLTSVLLALALTILAPWVASAEDRKKGEFEPDPKVTEADKDKAEELLDALDKAEKTKETKKILDAIEPLVTHRNEKFVKPLDKLAKHRETSIRVLAVRALGSQGPDKKVVTALFNVLSDRTKRNRKTPEVIAQSISSLRRIECDKRPIVDEISSRFKKPDEPAIMRECARYLGDLGRAEMVRALVFWVEAPQPADVNSDDNPPASYWETMWNLWEEIRGAVLYALRKITGHDYTSKPEWEIWLRSDEARKLGVK